MLKLKSFFYYSEKKLTFLPILKQKTNCTTTSKRGLRPGVTQRFIFSLSQFSKIKTGGLFSDVDKFLYYKILRKNTKLLI